MKQQVLFLDITHWLKLFCLKSTGGIFLVAIIFLSACSEDLEFSPQTPENYLPIQVGRYADYQVSYTLHNELLPDSNANYFLREQIAEQLTDDFGNVSYKIERSIRFSEIESWVIDSVWTMRIDGSRLIRTENNTPYIRLAFPLSEGKTWNGNAFNNKASEIYRVANYGADYSLADSLYGNSVEIIHSIDTNSFLDRDIRIEVFAENIGLVHKKSEVFIYCDLASCFGLNEIVGGYFYEQKLIGYGN